jgi:prevent-host-death family protein
MTITQVKAGLLSLIDEVEGGEDIEITRHGRTVARLTAARGPEALKGRFREIARSNAPDQDLFSTGEEWNAQ